MRPWLVFLLLGGLAAGEAEPPTPPFPPPPPTPAPLPLLSFVAARSLMSMVVDRPSEASAVRLRYENVRLECDTLRYRLTSFAGAPRPILATADFVLGPDGKVLFDSSTSQLPQMAFRGVMRPATVAVRRQDADPARPKEVRFRAEAAELGDVAGIVQTAAGGRAHVAWADRAVIEFVAAPDDAALGVTTPRLTAIHFYGLAAADGRPARPAVVLRLKQPPPADAATVALQLGTPNVGMRASGRTMSLFFDELGALSGYENDTGDYEVSDGEELVPRRSSSLPTLGK